MNNLIRCGRVLIVAVLTAGYAGLVCAQDQSEKKEEKQEPAAQQISKYPDPQEVVESVKKAVAYFRRNLSVGGGYAWSWSKDLSETRGENRTTSALIMIQPPGTPSVGEAMLDAHLTVGDPLAEAAAREAAGALLWCQYASGGWGADFSFEPQFARKIHYRRDVEAGDVEPDGRSNRSTLDDNKTQSAIRFLMHVVNSPAGEGHPEFRAALDFAWDGLLAAQAPNGGWPQGYRGPADAQLPVVQASFPEDWSREFPKVDYTLHYTLNDNNLLNVMTLLLDAHRVEKHNNERFLASARKLGDFLLLAVLPDPQPAWAQQYDFEMHPAWARKFEPPAVCTVESFGAMQALYDLWLATGDDAYLAPLPAAIQWFEESQVEEGVWARFYEMRTNKPLYCEADTYLVTYDDSNVPTHYGFKISGGFASGLDKLEAALGESHDEATARRDRPIPDDEKDWSDRARKLAFKVRDALKEQHRDGYWLKGGDIDAGEFVGHMRAMTDYVEAAEKGGEVFAKIREQQLQKEAEAGAKAKAAAETGKQ